jgi:small conductance mechanosensitive channel
MTLARGAALRLVKRAVVESGVTLPNVTYTIEATGSGTQPNAAKRKNPRATTPRADPKIATVSAQAEGALDRMIVAEREIGAGEDLLRNDAAKE